jgi:predicted aspartyl protease
MKDASQAFTVTYNGRSFVLESTVTIGQAFDTNKYPRPLDPEYTYKALWDTGATNTVITEKVVADCRLSPIGIIEVETAAGRHRSNRYLVRVGLPNNVGFPEVAVCDGLLAGDIEVLIGMDIIGMGDFAASCVDGQTVFTFRLPSTVRFNFADEINRKRAAEEAKLRKKRSKKGLKRR